MNSNHNSDAAEIIALIDRIDNLYMMWSKLQGENYYMSSVIYMLYASGIRRQKEMSECFGIPKQTVSSVVSKLEKEGLVTLVTDEKDRRGKLVFLSEKGNDYAESIIRPLMDCEKKTFDRLGREKTEQLRELLDEYAVLLEHEMKKMTKRNNRNNMKRTSE